VTRKLSGAFSSTSAHQVVTQQIEQLEKHAEMSSSLDTIEACGGSADACDG
jgi:hypothetical protein